MNWLFLVAVYLTVFELVVTDLPFRVRKGVEVSLSLAHVLHFWLCIAALLMISGMFLTMKHTLSVNTTSTLKLVVMMRRIGTFWLLVGQLLIWTLQPTVSGRDVAVVLSFVALVNVFILEFDPMSVSRPVRK